MADLRPGTTRARRLRKRRRYERNRNGAGAVRGPYGFTVRHVRCDDCQRDYPPQHVHRLAWRWACGNCSHEYEMMPKPALRWRYADEPRMLAALRLA